MCRKTAQRYYRCWSPCGTQCTARPSCGGTSQRYRSCQAWRYYRGAAGSTAGILRLKKKEPSGSTRQLPRGTVTNTESKIGLAVPLAVPPAVVPLAETSGTTARRSTSCAAGVPLQVERYYRCDSGTTARHRNAHCADFQGYKHHKT